MFIYRVIQALDQDKIDYAIVGGYAVALHGAVRGTIDVDLILPFKKNDFIMAEKAFKKIGLISRVPVTAEQIYNFREDYIKNRNMIAWSFYNPESPIDVLDVIITHDLSKLKTIKIKSGPHTLKVLAKADLIKMKKTSGRPQDLEDIKALEQIQ